MKQHQIIITKKGEYNNNGNSIALCLFFDRLYFMLLVLVLFLVKIVLEICGKITVNSEIKVPVQLICITE